MNIAFFITPKESVAFLYEDYTVRQALEKMKHHGYTSIPVISRKNKYVGTVSEGDFLWFLLERGADMNIKAAEDMTVGNVLKQDKNPPVRITATVEELVDHSVNQNFIPVLDDLDDFIGIITRKDIIKYYYEKSKA